MNKRIFRQQIQLAAIVLVFLLTGCNAFLHSKGLHPDFDAPKLNLVGSKALIITTSQAQLHFNGKETGVFGSELTHPYYQFLDAGLQVDVASINGGIVPIDPSSHSRFVRTSEDERSYDDRDFQEKISHSLPVSTVQANDYDFIFLAGGWGAAYDLGTSEELGRLITDARVNGAILGGVCHGPLGFLKAKDSDGSPLVKNKKMTAVTDKQIKELGITETPQHPETELRKAGVKFESMTASRDMFANHVVIDSNIVTGQNQNAGKEVAYRMMELRVREQLDKNRD